MKVRAFVRKTVLRIEAVRFLREHDYVVHDAGDLWVVEADGFANSVDLREDPIGELERVLAARLLIPGDADIQWWMTDTKPSGGGIRAALGEHGAVVVGNRKKPSITRAEEMKALSHVAADRGGER